ncbi:hypothetical protein PLESTB_001738800 [Pleodorina starrii]|uniref:Uncharacterized protein n=1 Tax=Pleodorina starrii TaxID=330485 RepID=A0A9W6BZS0_9CHLO|nr:hypothetical protein PLESTB_001738800 [Pleodorina starrii]
MSDTENAAAPLDTGNADEVGDVIRPVTAGTDAPEDEGGADASRPQTGVEGGDAGAAEGDAADRPATATSRPASARPDSARPASATPDSARPPSARPESAQPESARPESARPASARPPSASPDAARPPSATPDAARPASARPASARPPSARPASAGVAAPGEGQPAAAATGEAEGAEGEAADAAKPADAPAEAQAAAAEGQGEADPEQPASSQHPDVITDINQSPEAHAEVDAIAQQQAREVIRSRQNSATSERKAGGAAEEDKRRTSGSNASVKSAPPSRQGPDESIANMAMQPPSPSKIKTGPWLTGTYRLPKSGKIISGEELCDALERMTNAYIDKYTRERAPGVLPPKEIAPGAATVFNTKKLSHDEYDAMIARLYKPKDRNTNDSDRIQLITLKFGEDGQEQWMPVKQVSAEEQQAYMCQLYQRCLENRKKTQEELAAKYLKPLGAPRKR